LKCNFSIMEGFNNRFFWCFITLFEYLDINSILHYCRTIATEFLTINLYLNMRILSIIIGILLRIWDNSDLA
ncbi:MAG: hypothetical protein ACFFEY_17895, partial [Candidatus Thorarchaeota archaeon]